MLRRQWGPWKGYYSGYYVIPLLAEMDLQQNIFEAPFVGGFFETAVTGLYAPVPEPSGPVLGILGVALIYRLFRRSR